MRFDKTHVGNLKGHLQLVIGEYEPIKLGEVNLPLTADLYRVDGKEEVAVRLAADLIDIRRNVEGLFSEHQI